MAAVASPEMVEYSITYSFVKAPRSRFHLGTDYCKSPEVILSQLQVNPDSSKLYIRLVVAPYQTGIVKTIWPPEVGRDVPGVKVNLATLVASLAPTIFLELVTAALAIAPGANVMSATLPDVSAYVDEEQPS